MHSNTDSPQIPDYKRLGELKQKLIDAVHQGVPMNNEDGEDLLLVKLPADVVKQILAS